ncbi:MAG TPA: hypothetical protein VI758_05055 [Bacteroidota bacterium]
MKKMMISILMGMMSMAIVETARSQASATQTLTLAVNTVYKIATSGNPAPLTITTGTAGSNSLTSVSDNSTTYSITQNFGNTVKITANLDAALPAGYTLSMALASTKGTSAGSVDISNATSGSAVNVVTAIQRGADAGQTISYTFSALASAGTLSSTAKTVTLTITN